MGKLFECLSRCHLMSHFSIKSVIGFNFLTIRPIGNPEMNLDEFLGSDRKAVEDILCTHPNLDENFIQSLLQRLKSVLVREDNLMVLNSPLIICGDIHGQLYDLFRLFSLSPPIPDSRYLFLGDYVDRGYQSIQTFVYLAYLKVKFQDSVFLLRGNHESPDVNATYGLMGECTTLYGHSGLWHEFNEVFNYLPIAAVVDNRLFCVHGGLSRLHKLADRICTIDRFTPIPNDAFLQDLCWSDPDETVADFKPNSRGSGCLFGAKPVDEFLRVNALKLVVRAHQLAKEGMMWHFDKKLVTVWSAPNYCYTSKNLASVMRVDGDREPEFAVFQEDPRSADQPVTNNSVADYFA
jgi:diadenosine tetraphosphatase ApaH/serine/threonine PP2A family protein phosphatase